MIFPILNILSNCKLISYFTGIPNIPILKQSKSSDEKCGYVRSGNGIGLISAACTGLLFTKEGNMADVLYNEVLLCYVLILPLILSILLRRKKA